MALRTIKNSAEQKDKPVFLHFEKSNKETVKPDTINIDINDVMQNMGLPQFTYDTFKAAYDADPQVQEAVDNFSAEGIEMNSQSDSDETQGDAGDSDSVSQMAKSATDLGDSPLD
jgi:hypothetical protein